MTVARTAAALLTLGFALHAYAAEFKNKEQCVVGAKVTDRKDQTGTITKADGTMCQVTLDGSGEQKHYLFWMLRPAGTSKVTTDKLVNGTYPCYSLSGNTRNYLYMDVVIDGAESYRDKKGNKGRYKLDTATGKIVFESGPLAKANAKLMAGPTIGLNMDGDRFFNVTCNLKK